MNFKKILVIVIILVHGVFVFSQSEDSKMHFEKAKQYENNKQLIYALGEYYDAYVSDVNQTEARERFGVLLDAISEGNPGVGDFDVFELYDDWILLLQDYEKYWTEYCPFIIKMTKLERQSINTENKTATYQYTLSGSNYDNKKFSKITKAVKNGLYTAYSSQKWNNYSLYLLSTESSRTVYNNKNDENKYFMNDTAIFREYYEGIRMLASTTNIPFLEEPYEGARVWGKGDFRTTLYDIAIKIVDKNSNEIATIDRQLISNFKRTITLPAKDMKTIENGEYRVIPTALYLFYGNPEENPALTFKFTGERNFLKKLSEIKVDLSKVVFIDENDAETLEKIALKEKIIEENEQKLSAIKVHNQYLKEQIPQQFDGIRYMIEEFMNREIINTINKKSVEIQIDKNKIYYLAPVDINRMKEEITYAFEVLKEVYGYEKLENSFMYYLCNLASQKNQLMKFYYIEGTGDEVDFKYFIDNYGAIKNNENSNGWHLPTEEEVSFVLEKKKAADSKKKTGKLVKGLLGVSDSQAKTSLADINDEDIYKGNFMIRSINY